MVVDKPNTRSQGLRNVLKFEDIIKKSSEKKTRKVKAEAKVEEVVAEVKEVKDTKLVAEVKEVPETSNKPAETNDVKKIVKKPEVFVPKGKPKSGRVWKSERKRFSSIVKTRGIRNSFEKKQALRKELLRVKEASKALKESKIIDKQLKKERRRENLKRQEENRKKSEVVQVITNTSKIKKMRKKQLRYIEKRDTTTVG